MFGGRWREMGCDMRVEAVGNPPADEFTFARFFGEANENMGNAEHVVVQKDSKVEILGSRAITTWNENDELIQPVFSDVCLHVPTHAPPAPLHGEPNFAPILLPPL